MTYAAAIATQKFGKLVLYRATSQDGRAFYAYLRCDEKGMHRMRRDYESATPCRNAADYGELVYIALGNAPDAAALDYIERYKRQMA